MAKVYSGSEKSLNAECGTERDRKSRRSNLSNSGSGSDSSTSSCSGFSSSCSSTSLSLSAHSGSRSASRSPPSKRRGRSPQPKYLERSRSLPNEEREGPKPRPKSRERRRSPVVKMQRERKERSVTPKPTRIHINYLTRNVTKEHIIEIFGNFGKIKNVGFPTDRFYPNFGTGFAYIEYVKHEGCKAAIEKMNGGQIDGQPVSVSSVLTTKLRGHRRRSMPPANRIRIERRHYNRRSIPRSGSRAPRKRTWSSHRSPLRRPRRRSDISH